MERKIWIGLIVVIGMMLTAISGPVFGAQLAISSNDPVLYGRPIANLWAGEIIGNHFGFDAPGEIISWESNKMGIEVIPYFKSRTQWTDISNIFVSLPPDISTQLIFQSHGSVRPHNWATEEIFSNRNFFSKKNSKNEETDVSGLPPLPNVLWLCGFGIIGILSVRRTNDHSNVN